MSSELRPGMSSDDDVEQLQLQLQQELSLEAKAKNQVAASLALEYISENRGTDLESIAGGVREQLFSSPFSSISNSEVNNAVARLYGAGLVSRIKPHTSPRPGARPYLYTITAEGATFLERSHKLSGRRDREFNFQDEY